MTAVFTLCTVAACSEEPVPPSVTELMDDPILLQATMVRCQQDRGATRYEEECVNATEAAGRLAAAAEQARRDELEAQSERKRQALRRAREAAAEARRRNQEEQRRREEAALFGEFEPLPPADDTKTPPGEMPQDTQAEAAPAGISPGAATPGSEPLARPDLPVSGDAADASEEASLPEAGQDPEAVREELEGRAEDRRQ